MTETLLGNGTVVTATTATDVIERGALVYRGDRLVAVGAESALRRRHPDATYLDASAACRAQSLALCTDAQWLRACELHANLARLETWTATPMLDRGVVVLEMGVEEVEGGLGDEFLHRALAAVVGPGVAFVQEAEEVLGGVGRGEDVDAGPVGDPLV